MRPEISDKPYFPFLLGNGIDCVLIDYSGSMSCNSGHLHMEQHQGTVCAWYKVTHRDYRKPLLPILQSSYTLITGGEAYEVGDYSQSFDSKRAVLITFIGATDFRLKIETFLTSNQVLVERYVLNNLPKDKPAITFNLHPPVTNNPFLLFPKKTSYKFSEELREREINCDYELYGIKGIGRIYTDFPRVREEEFYGGRRLVLPNLERNNNSFTKYLLLLDEKDTLEYKEEAKRILNEIKQKGYKEILKNHQEEWEDYQSQSYLDLPDKRLEHLYYLSLYLIRAHQNPKTGLISIGNYPVLWAGGVTNTWDLIFPHKALLGSNRIKEAGNLIFGYEKVLPVARDYAQKIKAEGAYFPWFMNQEGKSLDFIHPKESPEIEKFNNGCLVMEVWDQYFYTGDKKVLEEHWSLIKETVDFLLSSVVEEKENIAEIKEGEGADESISRKNDTAHLLTTIKSLEALAEASKILGRKIDISYQKILEKLKTGLKQNYRGKILLPYKGAKKINTSLFTFYLFNLPKGIPNEGIEEGLKQCQGKWGMTNPGRYQNLIWPGAENRAAIALSYLKDKRAFEHLFNGTKYTSSLGAFSEKIRPDGFRINYWYLTSHASYVLALNTMLVYSKDNKIRIFPAIPDCWKHLEFKNLRVPPGILVSLRMREGRIKFIILENCTLQEVRKIIEVPFRYLKGNKLLLKGKPCDLSDSFLLKPHQKIHLKEI